MQAVAGKIALYTHTRHRHRPLTKRESQEFFIRCGCAMVECIMDKKLRKEQGLRPRPKQKPDAKDGAWDKFPPVPPSLTIAEFDESLPQLGEWERAMALSMFGNLRKGLALFLSSPEGAPDRAESLRDALSCEAGNAGTASVSAVLLFAKMLWKNPEEGIALRSELARAPPHSHMGALLWNSFLNPLTTEEAARFVQMGGAAFPPCGVRGRRIRTSPSQSPCGPGLRRPPLPRTEAANSRPALPRFSPSFVLGGTLFFHSAAFKTHFKYPYSPPNTPRFYGEASNPPRRKDTNGFGAPRTGSNPARA